jgi:hypothetical protein
MVVTIRVNDKGDTIREKEMITKQDKAPLHGGVNVTMGGVHRLIFDVLLAMSFLWAIMGEFP